MTPVRIQKVGRFLEAITSWAASQADLQGLALVGSYARNTPKPTSDVDLVLVVNEPNRYLQDIDWISAFGEIERHQIERYGLVTSVRVWYRDGLEVEFGLAGPEWAAIPLDEGTRQVIEDGMRVLFERGGILSRHLLQRPPAGPLP